jgi:3-oxoacyl-[acyl-carrier protein] reductase
MDKASTSNHRSLVGRTVLVTGASRPRGIGAAIAAHCARAGATVLLHGCSSYDVEQGYADSKDGSAAALARGLTQEGLAVTALPDSDLESAGAAAEVFRDAGSQGMLVDGLVLNHAYSTQRELGAWTAEHIDRHLHVNVRASMLLIQEFAALLPADKGGSVVLLTSGQYLGPMVGEMAYAVSKEAVRCLCSQAAAALSSRGIRVNSVNPGPTDTGYLDGEAWESVRARFPAGRWGLPSDAARLVAFLLSPDASWITGQTIASEGGFRR